MKDMFLDMCAFQVVCARLYLRRAHVATTLVVGYTFFFVVELFSLLWTCVGKMHFPKINKPRINVCYKSNAIVISIIKLQQSEPTSYPCVSALLHGVCAL